MSWCTFPLNLINVLVFSICTCQKKNIVAEECWDWIILPLDEIRWAAWRRWIFGITYRRWELLSFIKRFLNLPSGVSPGFEQTTAKTRLNRQEEIKKLKCVFVEEARCGKTGLENLPRTSQRLLEEVSDLFSPKSDFFSLPRVIARAETLAVSLGNVSIVANWHEQNRSSTGKAEFWPVFLYNLLRQITPPPTTGAFFSHHPLLSYHVEEWPQIDEDVFPWTPRDWATSAESDLLDTCARHPSLW